MKIPQDEIDAMAEIVQKDWGVAGWLRAQQVAEKALAWRGEVVDGRNKSVEQALNAFFTPTREDAYTRYTRAVVLETIATAISDAVKKERERCQKVVDECQMSSCGYCSDAIRDGKNP